MAAGYFNAAADKVNPGDVIDIKTVDSVDPLLRTVCTSALTLVVLSV